MITAATIYAVTWLVEIALASVAVSNMFRDSDNDSDE